ncbi:MAG: glycogen debranching protein GlgX [Bauldia sp.]|nr:glycogen debranching protein GlgX [Bauldia sp.]
MFRLDDGVPSLLGATFDGEGVNFAVFAEHASGIDLCVYDAGGRHEIATFALPRQTEGVWHGYLHEAQPGLLYGYRAYGPYEPAAGHRYNPSKLLIDPYARQLSGPLVWNDALYGYVVGSEGADPPRSRTDSAPFLPKSVVEAPFAMWQEPRRKAHWRDSVIYEAHVKGFTALNPDVPKPIRGTYDALGHPAVVAHLQKIGVTAVELLPIQSFVDDHFLVRKGLRNYWGYSTLNYFTPEPRYLAGTGNAGLRAAITNLHAAGIEVILDVVYNHTAEGNEFGPTLSFKGLDNAVYYKLAPENRRYYWDATGTGNTLNVSHPQVLRLVMDSLRYWVEAYHIDGFRFDLAPALARQPYDFEDDGGFLAAIGQDPVLRHTKLIAEPWDLGHDGYRVGQFPRGWSEWNDQFRDAVRGFWRGDGGRLPALAQAMTGSREVFEPSGRHPWSTVNFVTSHDGFTLNDLVSYQDKHNYRNGEHNRDGHSHNLSMNFGVEGPTDDALVKLARSRQRKNLLATLFLSVGTPMLLMGDERGHTQDGNNNAYCQDNDTSWLDWGAPEDATLMPFVEMLTELRRRNTAFRRFRFLEGRQRAETGLADVYWLAPEGRLMNDEDWWDHDRRTIGCQLGNDNHGESRFLLILNADDRESLFTLPLDFPSGEWHAVIDTAMVDGLATDSHLPVGPGGNRLVAAQSLVLLRHTAQFLPG